MVARNFFQLLVKCFALALPGCCLNKIYIQPLNRYLYYTCLGRLHAGDDNSFPMASRFQKVRRTLFFNAVKIIEKEVLVHITEIFPLRLSVIRGEGTGAASFSHAYNSHLFSSSRGKEGRRLEGGEGLGRDGLLIMIIIACNLRHHQCNTACLARRRRRRGWGREGVWE